MSTYKVIPSPQTDLQSMKAAYLASQPVALDGMWQAFSNMGEAFLIEDNSAVLGYGILNEHSKIIEFYTCAPQKAEDVFASLVTATGATGAFAATSDAPFFSLALDRHTSLKGHALMYEHTGTIEAPAFAHGCTLNLLNRSELDAAIHFVFETVGANQEWLEGYLGNLVNRSELFALRKGNTIIATGERRISDSQKPYADIGMIVGTAERGNGHATHMLRALAADCFNKGLKPICSTETGNLAAQKAIGRAGFFSRHRIVEINF